MSVRCSYCYNHGHNKRGCPEYKARMANLRAINPNDYRVVAFDAKANRGNVTCSWCGAGGHDRRKCGDYLAAREKTRILQSEMRHWFKDRCDEAGIGIGTIVVEGNYGRDRATIDDHGDRDTWLMNKFDLAALTVGNHNSFYDGDYNGGCKFKTINRESWGDTGISLRRLIFNVPATYYQVALLVIPAVDNTRISKDLPADWLSGEAGLDVTFKASSARRGLRGSSFDWNYEDWVAGFNRVKQQYATDCAELSRYVNP